MSLFGDDPRWKTMEDKFADLQAQVNQIAVKTNSETPLHDDAITALRDRIDSRITSDDPVGIYRIQLSNPTKDSYDLLVKQSEIDEALIEAGKGKESFFHGSAIKTLYAEYVFYSDMQVVEGGCFKWHEGFVQANKNCVVKAYDACYVSFRGKDISTVRKIYEFKPDDE